VIGLGLDSGVVTDGERMWDGWGHMWDGWGMGWAGGWMMLVWVLVLGLIVWGVVALTRSSGRDTRPTPSEVLEMRFARGEITEEEYRQARAALKDDRTSR
jgi:putative membrane protein